MNHRGLISSPGRSNFHLELRQHAGAIQRAAWTGARQIRIRQQFEAKRPDVLNIGFGDEFNPVGSRRKT
jgi:hypothetical protein